MSRPMADWSAPLPATVIARCADTAATHGFLTIEGPWLRCDCGAWHGPLFQHAPASLTRLIARDTGWTRIDGDGPWRCPDCTRRAARAAAKRKRRAAA